MTPDTASVFALTAVEKLQLVEDLWDDISSRPDDVPVHPWQLEETSGTGLLLLHDRKRPCPGMR